MDDKTAAERDGGRTPMRAVAQGNEVGPTIFRASSAVFPACSWNQMRLTKAAAERVDAAGDDGLGAAGMEKRAG